MIHIIICTMKGKMLLAKNKEHSNATIVKKSAKTTRLAMAQSGRRTSSCPLNPKIKIPIKSVYRRLKFNWKGFSRSRNPNASHYSF